VPDYTRCRTLGHAWFDVDSDWKSALGSGTPLTLRCERCMCERRDTVATHTGQLISRHYFYPDQYRMLRDERPTRDEFRLMLLSLRLKERRAAKNGVNSRNKAAS
jgi:hypothetical protein